MKIKNIPTLILAAAMLLTLPSCEKFVEVAPVSDLTNDNAYKTASDAEAALVGTYDSYHNVFYYWDNILFNDIISDNYYAGGMEPEVFPFDDITVMPTNSRLFINWGHLYNGIARANVVLKRVPEINDPKLDINNRRAQILGEAAFVRAYHYFQLVKMWGGVPLVLEPVASIEPTAMYQIRATEEEVYKQIIKDLEFAIARLPHSFSAISSINKARATKGAANALIAKVYAQKPTSGYPKTQDYEKVLMYCDSVYKSPLGYKLMTNFDDLYNGLNYNNVESIMEIQFTAPPESNWGPQMTLPPNKGGWPFRKFVVPSKDLVNAFESEGDVVRQNASIVWDKPNWTDEFWSDTLKGKIPFSYKWRKAAGWVSDNRQYLLRFADIVLLKAEALNELGRPSDAAIEVNKVRQRVNLPLVPLEKMASQDEMRLVIEKERRLELCQEAHRWDDLRRYGKAVEVMNNLNEINLITKTRKEYNMTVEKQLLPIPQQERDRNPMLGQNPGYN